MEQFSRDWLALRGPSDRASRSKALARAFLDALPRDALVADLACGAGANAHYLMSLGRHDIRWSLIDADRTLLPLARGRLRRGDPRSLDLARPRRALGLDRYDGVTASALCDLVSAAWLDKAIAEAARNGLPLLFALTVDGRVAFSPGDPSDAIVMHCFRRDQTRDKGFGPALGPRAPRGLARVLRQYGYGVRWARSDWRLGPGDTAMLCALVAGFADVGLRDGAVSPSEIKAWRRRREAQVAGRQLSLVVGHVDLFATLRGGGSRKQDSHTVTLP